ncbi:MAG: hypothetical protein HQL23_09170 [Candidatus Omnitrophica bacterium]|nr:hypothetical protein [Candidatus Omnitrophota bacterium]
MITGLAIDPSNPLKLKFIFDPGQSYLAGAAFEKEAKKLIRYFLTALTVPETEQWVNLSPYQKEKLIPWKLGQTEMGQCLLGQDYVLKQLTATLLNPENATGKKFWQKIYDQAKQKYGTTDIPVNLFQRVWIVPEKAVIYEKGFSATIVKTHLKVLLEEDYLALNKNFNNQASNANENSRTQIRAFNQLSAKIIREIIIPEIEKAVNEQEAFSGLRQIYHAMILAAWSKGKFSMGLLGRIYTDRNKIKGIDHPDEQLKARIYQQYIESFQKGMFDYVKDDDDLLTDEIISRRYISGGLAAFNPQDGFDLAQRIAVQTIDDGRNLDPEQRAAFFRKGKMEIDVSLIENPTNAQSAFVPSENHPATGRVHFVFNDHSTLSQYSDQIKDRIKWADFILIEEHPLFQNIIDAVSKGGMTPSMGWTAIQTLAGANGIRLPFSDMRLAVLQAVYQSGKTVYTQQDVQPAIVYRAEARQAWEEVIYALVGGDGARTYQSFLKYVQCRGRTFYHLEKTMTEQIQAIRYRHPGANILAIFGASHTPPFVYFKRMFPQMQVTREFLGFGPAYILSLAAQRAVSFQQFGLTPRSCLSFDPQLIAALASVLLPSPGAGDDWEMINRVAKRVNTMEQLQNLADYMRNHPPPPDRVGANGTWPEGVIMQRSSENMQEWLVLNQIATLSEIHPAKKPNMPQTPTAASPVEAIAEAEKGILGFLERRDYPSAELEQAGIEDIVILGNEKLETFREALRLFQRGIGKRIYIAGGHGRLTLPLIDCAIAAGFEIRITDEKVLYAPDWFRLRAETPEPQLRTLVKQTEAQMIRQIMVLMLNQEPEFKDLQLRLRGQDPEKIFINNPDDDSRSTPENFFYYQKFLNAEGNLSKSEPFVCLYIQTPHQQMRSKATFDNVFKTEIGQNRIHGASYTISYTLDDKTPEQIAEDLLGELWRLIVYSQIRHIRLESSVYPQGMDSFPENIWDQGLALLRQFDGDVRQKLASRILKITSEHNYILDQLSPQVTEDARAFVEEIRYAASAASSAKSEFDYGGINLNAQFLDLQIKRDELGVPLPLPLQSLNRMRIEGFLPIITKMREFSAAGKIVLWICPGIDSMRRV